MSALSNQPAAAPFSEYSELCKSTTHPERPGSAVLQDGQQQQKSKDYSAPEWEWQRTEGKLNEIGVQMSLGGQPRAAAGGLGGKGAGLTDEDKLCFFEGQGVEKDLKVPAQRIVRQAGNSLGSAGESPESPLSFSSSLFGKSPASPSDKMTATTLTVTVVGTEKEAGRSSNGVQSASIGKLLPEVSISTDCETEETTSVWNPHFHLQPEPSTKEETPNYIVIGIVNDNYLEGGNGLEQKSSPTATMAKMAPLVITSREAGEDTGEEVELFLSGRATQQRHTMRRAMSECSHLSVPDSLELPDKYPMLPVQGDGLLSPVISGLNARKPLSQIKRSMTVSEEQSPALSTFGSEMPYVAEKSDVRPQQPQQQMEDLCGQHNHAAGLNFPHTHLEGIPEVRNSSGTSGVEIQGEKLAGQEGGKADMKTASTQDKPTNTQTSSSLVHAPDDPSRPRVAPVGSRSNATTPSSPGTPLAANRTRTPKPPTPTATADKKLTPQRGPPKTSPAPKTTPRPASAAGAGTPTPVIKNVRSKIGSTDNIKYQPGGGKVQIVTKKNDYSHVTSRCGSKDNIKHVPGGGNVQILNKKVDLSKVTSKCGSKTNINHKPGGGEVKIESHKTNLKEKTQSKIGSMDNVGHEPGSGNVKAEGEKEEAAAEGTLVPPSGALSVAPPGSEARENGVRETPACTGETRETKGLDPHIPETSK
ncbi:Microtubule-associated protein tau [Acipenser ruthenus]|uniref:Microtubule-associated protein n=1 Tax=Acipenser ruthenus TaxID=7906 RepID=A0A444TZQ8_ACIRT|nr:Microtubule-associated protein tau [Acipenser ruthenus]